MDKQEVERLNGVLDEYNLSTNPFKSTAFVKYLWSTDPIRVLLADYNRLGIYKLYPYEFQLVANSCKMVARSAQLAKGSDNVELMRIVDATRLASPMISITTTNSDSWDWIPDDFMTLDTISRSEIALECFTSEWIDKLGDKSLAEYYLTMGDKSAAEYLMLELWESLIYWKLANTSTNARLIFGALVSVYSRYAMVSAVSENPDLLSSTSDILIPAAADRFKKGVNTTEYEELINKIE